MPVQVLQYQTGKVYADYGRAAFGLFLTLTPLLLLELSPWVGVPLAACAALFLAFAAKAMLAQLSRIEVTDEAVNLRGPLNRTIRWDELASLKLSYYATRREKGSGWMQLALGSGSSRMSIESTLDGFDQLVERAIEAASRNRVPLSDRTIDNVEALGLAVPAPNGQNAENGLI